METSVGQYANFQSNNRWNNNNIYQGINAYCTEQIFNLNPTTLVQTPVTNAWEYVYGDYVGVMGAGNGGDQVSRTGGRPNFLDNGNIVVMIDDKAAIASVQGEVCTFRIIKPDGSLVAGPILVNPGVLLPYGTPGSGGIAGYDIWDNMCAFKGGFAIRLHQYLYFFDNNGNQTFTDTNIVQSTGLSFGTNREDASRIGSDIRSYYVYLAGQTPESNPNGPVHVAIWDSRTGLVVTKATVSELDASYARFDRTMIAVDALDRFCVAYKLAADGNFYPNVGDPNWQVAARVGQFNGSTVSWLTPSFYPFVNHDSYGGLFATAYRTLEPHVSMTTRQICISAKGTINSTNNPAAEPDTLPNTALYTVITHPAAVAAGPTMTVTRSGSNVIISWNADAGLFTLVSSSNAAAPLSSWAAVSPQPATTGPVNGQYSMTVPIGAGAQYFKLKR